MMGYLILKSSVILFIIKIQGHASMNSA
jgi:hypothetical protein